MAARTVTLTEAEAIAVRHCLANVLAGNAPDAGVTNQPGAEPSGWQLLLRSALAKLGQ